MTEDSAFRAGGRSARIAAPRPPVRRSRTGTRLIVRAVPFRPALRRRLLGLELADRPAGTTVATRPRGEALLERRAASGRKLRQWGGASRERGLRLCGLRARFLTARDDRMRPQAAVSRPALQSRAASRTARLLALAACALGGCSVRQVKRGAPLDEHAAWGMLPVRNFAETPLAGERTRALVATLLRIRGIGDLREYPDAAGKDDLPDLDDQRR